MNISHLLIDFVSRLPLVRFVPRRTFSNHLTPEQTTNMKTPKHIITSNASAFPRIRFETNTQLTGFAGIQIFSTLFSSLELKNRLRKCCSHLSLSSQYSPSSIIWLLIVHVILGFSRLRDVHCYQQDPLVLRFLGMGSLPSASTLSRLLSKMDESTADKLVELIEGLVVERLKKLKLKRLTIDFDGSISTTNGHAEGTAVGFNPKKKGQRSYYPLFATVAQLDQVFSVLHRSGNVHDSHQAGDFISRVVGILRKALPKVVIEVRADSAFYSDKLLGTLEQLRVEYTVSVPFERYANLKNVIEERKRWRRVSKDLFGFKSQMKAKQWKGKRCFVFVKKKVKKQTKGPIQLDLFVPHEDGFEFKAIVTNKKKGIKSIVLFHQGRGSQEKIFGEMKNGTRIDYLPCRREAGNRVYMLCNILAHNLSRELQIENAPRARTTNAQRACLWIMESLSTLRKNVINRAGRLTRPNGTLTLTIPADNKIRRVVEKFIPAQAFS